MTWAILDEVSIPRPARVTEDRAGTRGPVAWILDGASAVTEEHPAHGFASDALWLVHHLDVALHTLADRDDLSLEHLVARAIGAVAERADREWEGRPDVPPSAALGIVRHAGDRTEYLVLADVSVILRRGPEVVEIIDPRVDACSAAVFETMADRLANGLPYQEALAAVKPDLAEHRRKDMNTDGGYWVASFEADAVDHARRGSVAGVDELILATDGFMRVLRSFGIVPDVEALFAPGRSLPELAQRVRAAERDDPETRHSPRWSVHDDICAHRLTWKV
jgi:hypothetical protein